MAITKKKNLRKRTLNRVADRVVKRVGKGIDKKKQIGKQLLFHVFEVNWEYETQRIIKHLRDTGALMAYIDLFCGAGGTSTGMEEAEYLGQKLACVILGINHDRG